MYRLSEGQKVDILHITLIYRFALAHNSTDVFKQVDVGDAVCFR
jgi:hypothetical protein